MEFSLNSFHIIINSILVGLILVTQFITYPSFKYIDVKQFVYFHQKYTNSITCIVLPLMLFELIFVFLEVYKNDLPINIANLTIVIVIWLLTILALVPIHDKLSNNYDLELIKKLVNLNFLRTGLWIIKLVFLTYLS